MQDWIAFRRLHPIGEERDDLRIGALGSIIWNCNIDTRNGKDIKADRYIVGWGRDRKHVMQFRPHDNSLENDSDGSETDGSLNNPAVWAELKANIKAAAKGNGIGQG